MNCREFQDWLQEKFDERSEFATAPVQDHLRACSECRTLFDAAQRLQETLPRLARPQPARLFTESIVAAVVAECRQTRRVFMRRMTIGVAVAASILLVAIAGQFGFFSRNDAPIVVKNN